MEKIMKKFWKVAIIVIALTFVGACVNRAWGQEDSVAKAKADKEALIKIAEIDAELSETRQYEIEQDKKIREMQMEAMTTEQKEYNEFIAEVKKAGNIDAYHEAKVREVEKQRAYHEAKVREAEAARLNQMGESYNKGHNDAIIELIKTDMPQIMILTEDVSNPYYTWLESLEQDIKNGKRNTIINYVLLFLCLFGIYFIIFSFISGNYKIVRK